MAPFNNYHFLNNEHNGLHDDGMDSADMYPTIEESSFCSNFQCCGRSLKDLHELLQHYEDSHVRIEDGDEEPINVGMLDFDTVLAADSLLNVGAEVSNRSLTRPDMYSSNSNSNGLLTPAPSSYIPSHSHTYSEVDFNRRTSPIVKRARILTLGIEPCDYASDDSEHLSAFDNTVIRPVDPNHIYNSYNGLQGYARIAPKRSHSVPALPNFPLINGESGFKLIHSILLSTADPPSSENYSKHTSGTNSPHGNGNNGNGSSSHSSNGYQSSSYNTGRSGSERPFVCPVSGCGKTYKNANGLKYHAIHGHDGVLVEKPHKCPFGGCGKRYKNSNGLKYHFQHAHPNTPPPSGLAMTPFTNSGYENSVGSYHCVPQSQSQSSSHNTNFASSSSSSSYGSSTSAFIPSRPNSTSSNSSNNNPVQMYRPIPTSTSSLNNTSSFQPQTLSTEAIQSLLASAPNAIANLLKKNPNLKQHLPTIIRNLQQMALQKSNNTQNNTNNNEITVHEIRTPLSNLADALNSINPAPRS